MFFHWRFTWAKCFLNHLTKVKWSFDFFLNGKLLSNKDLKKTFIKLLVYIYTNVQLCFNFIFIILVISFNFETQIIYMRSLKLFKMSEILPIGTSNIICSFKFATNCVIVACQHQKDMVIIYEEKFKFSSIRLSWNMVSLN
jgi:hypothetical protein